MRIVFKLFQQELDALDNQRRYSTTHLTVLAAAAGVLTNIDIKFFHIQRDLGMGGAGRSPTMILQAASCLAAFLYAYTRIYSLNVHRTLMLTFSTACTQRLIIAVDFLSKWTGVFLDLIFFATTVLIHKNTPFFKLW